MWELPATEKPWDNPGKKEKTEKVGYNRCLVLHFWEIGLSERSTLVQAIASLESRRPLLGDDVVETAVWALRQQLSNTQTNIHSATTENAQQITVLVADVVGFTAISEKMDAEHVGNAMNVLWEHLDGVIIAWGGRIDKHVGDNIIAYFGVPQPHADDPKRAVLAALEIQMILDWFNRPENRTVAQNLFPDGVGVQMRIGIHSGSAFVGSMGVNDNYTAVGETVSIAESLEAAAPHGGVLISAEMHKLVGAHFIVEPVSSAWLVVDVQEKLLCITKYADEDGIPVRMVGHLQEFEQLQNGLQYVMDTHSGQAIVLIGVEGIGKSKILAEFGNWLSIFPAPIRLICGHGFRQHVLRPYAFLRNVLESYFNLHVRYHEAAAGQTLVVKLHKEFMKAGLETALAYQYAWSIAHLVGFDFAPELQLYKHLDTQDWLLKQAVQGFLCLLTAVADKGTLIVLLLEDIDFATNGDLDFIERLVAASQTLPLLLVASALPEFEQKRPSWFAWSHDPFSAYQKVELHPLSAIDSRHLVNTVLNSVNQLPMRLVDIIVSIAAGSPFAIKEMVCFLRSKNVIEGTPIVDSVHMGQLNSLRLPVRFEDLLRMQILQLSSQAQIVLKRASVMGRLFGATAVAQLGAADQIEIDGLTIQAILDELETRGIILRSPTMTFMGVQEYLFRYDFWRQAAYNLLDVELARAYHTQCAYWWITTCLSSQLPQFAPVIADHFMQAGEGEQAAGWNGRV